MKRHADTTDRRKSRELALCTLYAYEVDRSEDWREMLESIAENDSLSEKVKSYAAKLVGSSIANIAHIDAMISGKAANWELRRMAAVDRNVLRFAVAELVYSDEAVPYKVVIDEAVEVAKTYGTDDSGKFVNGILDSIRKDIKVKNVGADDNPAV
jgi:N utilization substance protein B